MILGKVHKSGMYSTVTHNKNKKKRKKRRPLTPEEKEIIINHIEKKVKESKRIYDRQLGDEIEWTREEIEQQRISLLPDNPNEIQAKRKKLNILCGHKQCVVKNGYFVCIKCKGKWPVKDRIGFSK